jgi:hypothetical protein
VPDRAGLGPALPPCIRLLPIETRASACTTSDFREDAAAWTVLPLDLDTPAAHDETFLQVSLTRRVPSTKRALRPVRPGRPRPGRQPSATTAWSRSRSGATH